MAEGVSAHFRDDGRAAVEAARRLACDVGAAQIETGHLVVGVLENADADTASLAAPYGLTAAATRRRLIPARPDDPVVESPAFDMKVKAALRLANMIALSRDGRIGCVHLLLAMVRMRESSVLAFLRDRAELDALAAGLSALIE